MAPDRHYGMSNLIAATDEHTRKLLTRGRLERRSRLVPRSLLAADLLGLSVAYVLTTFMWGDAGAFGSFHEILVFLGTLPCWAIVAKLQGLYRNDQEQADHSTTDDIVGVFHLVTIGAWVLLVATRVGGRPNPSIYAVITFWFAGDRASCPSPARSLAAPASARTRIEQNTVIVGAGEVGQLIARKLVKHPEYGRQRRRLHRPRPEEPAARTCPSTWRSWAVQSGWPKSSSAWTSSEW